MKIFQISIFIVFLITQSSVVADTLKGIEGGNLIGLQPDGDKQTVNIQPMTRKLEPKVVGQARVEQVPFVIEKRVFPLLLAECLEQMKPRNMGSDQNPSYGADCKIRFNNPHFSAVDSIMGFAKGIGKEAESISQPHIYSSSAYGNHLSIEFRGWRHNDIGKIQISYYVHVLNNGYDIRAKVSSAASSQYIQRDLTHLFKKLEGKLEIHVMHFPQEGTREPLTESTVQNPGIISTSPKD